ncbi:MAG TPA: hypothetical protein VN519_07565 [Bryobacteraceae bacterium]|nr:hypothetical protein [Bryobacteraceae bacterium]
MLFRIVILCLLVAASGLADDLHLKDGRVIHGMFVSGDTRSVRFDVNGDVQNFSLSDVDSIHFENAATSDANAAPAPQPPPAPATPPVAAAPATPAAPAAPPAPAEPPAPAAPPVPPDNSQSADASQPSSVQQLPSGTQITVRMIDDVDSERDSMGKTFRASIDEPVMVDGQTVIPRGADATVKLVADQQSGKIQGKTVLTLALQQVQANGRMVDISTQDVEQASASRGARSAKVVGGTAALGAIIGALAGGGKGAAIGAASGGAVGAGVQVATKGQRVRIPSETRLTFTLSQPANL